MEVVNLQSLRQEIDARFACTHPRARLCVKVASNGARHFRVQCMRCGEHRGATRDERAKIPEPAEYDEELRQAWSTAKGKAYHDAFERQRNAEKRAWFDQYSEYLASSQWRAKRKTVLERDEGRCQARLDGCTVLAEEVHHTTYAHWWDAPLFELVSLCTGCHQQITEMDRAR